MGENKKVRVYLTDHMVVLGFVLTIVYWVLDSILYVFLSYDVDFFYHITGLNLNEIWTRVIVCCLFIIFGSHSQYTINKRKVIERQLQKSEEKHRTILENIDDGYFEINKNGRITFFNNALCNILGYISSEIQDIDQAAIFDKDSAARAYDKINDVWATGKPANIFDLLITRKDGTPVYTEASISLIRNRANEPIGFRGVLRDVTERRKTEALEQEKSAAEYANKAKSDFLANMNHEIRTPLNAIIGLTELLVETDLSDRQKEDLNVVLSAAHSLLNVINDILDFSKIEAGKLELETTNFNLRSLVEDSIKIVATKAHEKGLALESWIDPEVPVMVAGDPFRLRQILLNLVGNAIKFTDSGSITTRVTCREQKDRSAEFFITVADTGIGIAAENVDGVFGAFEQADGSTTRKYGGTGLGLAVSKQLVEMMAGTISVESQVGQGSTFAFTAGFGLEEDTRLQDTWPDSDFSDEKLMLIAGNDTTRQILSDTLDAIISAGHFTTPDLTAAQKEITAAIGTGEPYTLVLVDNDYSETDLLDFYSFLGSLEPVPGVICMLPLAGKRIVPDPAVLTGFTTIAKPVFPIELIDTLIAATDAEADDFDDTTARTQPAEQILPSSELKILVAEDTPFNQKFVARLFERWNLNSVIVENGRIAVDKLAEQPFDMVLMDVQMPEMDGFEATRLIREKEAENDQPPIPIIAMTAYAMKGDMERCLESGMDGYVSKPISAELLKEEIIKFSPTDLVREAAVAPAPAESPLKDYIDNEKLLQAFDDDMEFLEEAVGMFCEDYPPMIAAIDKALSAGDHAELGRTAHGLKGMLGNFQADEAVGHAFSLENMGKNKECNGGREIFKTLVQEVNNLEKALTRLIQE